ncbi:MAG: site-specific DNA-methyltransferase [Brevinemataceae bacterium]
MNNSPNLSFQDYNVILDFPEKDHLFFEKNSNSKDETCVLEYFDSVQSKELLSPKLFHNWKYISKDSITELSDLSLDSNFLFKGNNLIILHSLVNVFRNQVKLIYIDPPYNTGNTFVYKDKFSRSVWLLFMKNRIEASYDFLQNDGILVVQCDENEQAYLKILLDEIYGEKNFLGMITVVTNPGGRDYRSLARTHEYLIVYGKSSESSLYPLELDKEFPYTDELGGFELRSLRNGNIRFHVGNRPNLCYPFYVDLNSEDENGLFRVSLTPQDGFIEIFPKLSQGIQTVWRWGKEKAATNITEKVQSSNLAARRSKDSFLIFEKYRKSTRLARTVWTEKDFHTNKGTRHLKEVFGTSVFDYPKPELLISRIIDITTKKGDRVMDFFLGSGTTASVAQKAERFWIGIEQMEYINTVTVPRLQYVLSGEQGGASLHYHWKGGGGFVYAELSELSNGQFPFYQNFTGQKGFSARLYQK